MKKSFFFLKNVSRHPNLPDESAQNVSKKIHFGRIIPPFFFENSKSDRFFKYSLDSNSIFRAGRINSENVFGRTVKQKCWSRGVYWTKLLVPPQTGRNQEC